MFLSDIKERIDAQQKVTIGTSSKRILFLRPVSGQSTESDISSDADTETDYNDVYRLVYCDINKVLCMNRFDDFKNILQAVNDGHRDNKIAFHLLLDVGQFSMDKMAYDR